LAARRRGLLLSGRIDLLLFAANLNLGALNLFLHKHLILDCQSFTLMHLLGLKLQTVLVVLLFFLALVLLLGPLLALNLDLA
jgi:hypothetical protein